MEYIVPIVLLTALTLPIFFFIQSHSKNGDKKESKIEQNKIDKKLFIKIDIDLLGIELKEAKGNIDFINQMLSLRRYRNFPKRYYDYKKIEQNFPLKISRLKNELEISSADKSRFDHKSLEFYNELLILIRRELNVVMEMKNELENKNEGDGAPNGWYELTERERLCKKKLNYLESKIKRFN